MTTRELQWFDVAVTFILTAFGIAIGAFRSVGNRIDGAVKELSKAIKEGYDQLHDRIGQTRDDMSNGYVRRVDLDSHMRRTDDALKEMRDDQKAIMQSLAALEAKRGDAK